jgi:hypothetical protein
MLVFFLVEPEDLTIYSCSVPYCFTWVSRLVSLQRDMQERHTDFWLDLKGRDYLENLGINRRTVLKWKFVVKLRITLDWYSTPDIFVLFLILLLTEPEPESAYSVTEVFWAILLSV